MKKAILPLMITQATKASLRQIGYDDDQISTMNATDALQILFLHRLHRDGQWAHLWTWPGKRSAWFPADKPLPTIPKGWKNVYFSVHPLREIPPTNAKGQPAQPEYTKSQVSYVAAINCLFSEFDSKDFSSLADLEAHIDSLDPQPSVIVDSGGGLHCYWLLSESFYLDTDQDRDRAARLQGTWVKYTGGDPGAKDLARVLRLPGTQNHKYSPSRDVAFCKIDLNDTYTLINLENVCADDLQEAPNPDPIPAAGDTPWDVAAAPAPRQFSQSDDLVAAIRNLDRLASPRCDDYQAWISVGMALSELGDPGLAIWEQWSQKSPKYQPGICAQKWQSFKPGNGRSLASLAFWANEDDPGGQVGSPPAAKPGSNGQQAQQAQSTGWRIYTLEDAYTPRPPIEYVVDGLFSLPSLSIVYGPPGCLKTMLLIDMAACVVCGAPFLPPLPGQADGTDKLTRRSPILWVDLDNGARTMHERIEAAGRIRLLSTSAPLYYMSMPSPWIDMSKRTAPIMLANQVKALGARLLLLDNLRDISGAVDENSGEMGTVMSNLRRLAEDTGAAVVVVHHQRKTNGFSGRQGDTLRGHSSIEAAIDLALLIEREDQADTIKVMATKTRQADVYPFGAMFTYEHRVNSTELDTFRFFGIEVEDVNSDAAIRRAILEVVKVEPKIKQSDIIENVQDTIGNVGRSRIRSQIAVLTNKGQLAYETGAHNAKLYRLPDDAWHVAAMATV